jgi:hypothetical protein
MARYIATVEYDAGEYWISFPGIEKAGSHAKRVEDIVPHARAFLKDWTRYGSVPPVSLDDAIADPTAPFEGTKLIIFEWEPPRSTGHRIAGYENDELVIKIPVPVDKIGTARALAKVPETDPNLRSSYPLTRKDAHEIGGVAVPPGFTYFLEADTVAAA